MKRLIRSLLGTASEKAAKKPADPNDLVALSRVSLNLETKLGYETVYEGGLAFSDVDTTKFQEGVEEVKEIIKHEDNSSNTIVERRETYGTDWIHIKDSSVDSLIVNLQYGASSMRSMDYGSRLLAAVLPLQKDNKYAYVIYSFKRGKFYPFVPLNNKRERDGKEEMKIESILREEIDVEEDKSYWYPLWPKEHGKHPWE